MCLIRETTGAYYRGNTYAVHPGIRRSRDVTAILCVCVLLRRLLGRITGGTRTLFTPGHAAPERTVTARLTVTAYTVCVCPVGETTGAYCRENRYCSSRNTPLQIAPCDIRYVTVPCVAPTGAYCQQSFATHRSPRETEHPWVSHFNIV